MVWFSDVELSQYGQYRHSMQEIWKYIKLISTHFGTLPQILGNGLSPVVNQEKKMQDVCLSFDFDFHWKQSSGDKSGK